MITHRTTNEADLTPLEVRIPCAAVTLEGTLAFPPGAKGVVVFAHGSGSSRYSPRNQFVARVLRESGNGTLLFDLLTAEEEIEDNITRSLRFDIGLLARRLAEVTRWLVERRSACDLGIGYFGSSTGAGAALLAAAEFGQRIDAVVSRGGRPDLAGDALARVQSPTLLIVGGYDDVVIRLNKEALAELCCERELKIVPGATHLFEEPGALEAVAGLATDWFCRHFHTHSEATD
ncbi:MAG TPA: dienelactone hydrolase family protein [Chthoniobacterales bacterium]|nr:dienelactone hydrolase family protein [Chthoniobacterales bacterium]